MKITPEVIQFGIGVATDIVKWIAERKARGLVAAPTDAEVLARVKAKISASLAEGQAALDSVTEPPAAEPPK